MSITTPLVRLRVLPALLPVDGINADIRVSPDGLYLQKRIGLGDWENLVALDALQGPIGPETELRSNGSYVQWRPKGSSDTAWRDLFALSEIGGGNGGGSGGGPVAFADITGKPTTLGGYGITDGASQSDLTSGLAGKANTSHTHAISAVTGLQSALDGKAATSHTQAISTITGLQSALDGKSSLGHTHSISDVTGLTAALAAKESTANKGQPSGYASLGSDGKVPAAQLPAVDSGSSDAANVFYYPAPSIAVPVAQRLGQEVYLTDGYVEGSNLTDFSELIAANLARAVATKRPFIIPQGLFKAKRQFTADNTAMAMYGLGKYQSAIQWTADAASAGLRFTSGTNRRRPDFMHFEKFALFTEQFNQGEALWCSFENQIDPNGGNPVVGNRYSTRFRAQDIAIAGAQGGTSDGWNKGLTCLYEIDAICRDVQINGPINGSEPNYLMEHAIYIGAANGYGHPTGPFVDTCNVFHAKRAVVFEGNEGGVVTNSQLVGVHVGVDFVDNAGRPLLMCTNNHINAFGACIRADAAAQIQIIGNSLYHTIGADRDGVGVSIAGTQARSQHVLILGNTFESAIASDKVFTGVVIYGCDHGVIDGNTFRTGVLPPSASNMKGIVLSTDARFIKVGDMNVFEDARSGRQPLITEIQDGGTSNRIPFAGARYRISSTQNFGGSEGALSFDGGVEDRIGFSTPTYMGGSFTVPTDGIYEFVCQARWTSGSPAGQRRLFLRHNGVQKASAIDVGNGADNLVQTVHPARLKCRRGDTIAISAFAIQGGTINGNEDTFFEFRLVA